jgi:hypothetical protein
LHECRNLIHIFGPRINSAKLPSTTVHFDNDFYYMEIRGT